MPEWFDIPCGECGQELFSSAHSAEETADYHKYRPATYEEDVSHFNLIDEWSNPFFEFDYPDMG